MHIRENFGNPEGKLGKLMLDGMNIGHSKMAEWTLKQFDWLEDAKVLDIGCGGGANIRRLLRLCPKGRIYGVDISETSVRKSRELNRTELGKRCKIEAASVEKLPFKSRSLDVATAFETVYFWPDLSSDFKEVFRVLKPGGKFIVSCDSGDPDSAWDRIIPNMRVYSLQELKEYMEGAGFDNIEMHSMKNMICISGTVPAESAAVQK